MMRIVDLSHPVTSGMPVYPGDPEVRFRSALTVENDGVAVQELTLGTHTGTHIDAPSHSIVGGAAVDAAPLEWLVGDAQVVHASAAPREEISFPSHRVASVLPRIVCIASGWDRYFHDPRRELHPYLSLEFAEELWKRGARVLGVDMLSPDPTGVPDATFAVHEFWLGHGGVIVENLKGITNLPEKVRMSLLPLNLAGLDGSPIRAIAFL